MHEIREARPDESARIEALIAETLLRCVLGRGDAYETLFGGIRALIGSWAGRPEGVVHLVCVDGTDLIGVVLVSRYERLDLLFVHPSRQRAGVGTRLLDRAIQACRRAGAGRRLTLNSSHYAEPFYRKYGFVPNGPPQDKPGGFIPMTMNL